MIQNEHNIVEIYYKYLKRNKVGMFLYFDWNWIFCLRVFWVKKGYKLGAE